MATIAGHHDVSDSKSNRGEMGRSAASWYAWVCWVALLLSPFLYFVYVAYVVSGRAEGVRNPDGGVRWFIGSMIYLAVGGTAAIFWRSYTFRNYWKGQVVAPKDYLIGVTTLWVVLEIGGLVALTGCLVYGQLMPCIIPAAVAFVFFCVLHPNGRAMTKTVGDLDDPARYEEPR